jgi:hypothetical protein
MAPPKSFGPRPNCAARKIIGKVGGTNRLPTPEAIFKEAKLRYDRGGPLSMLSYCKLEEINLQCYRFDNTRTGIPYFEWQRRSTLGELARVHGPGFSGPFPITGTLAKVAPESFARILMGAGEFILNICKAAIHFFEGLFVGLSQNWSQSDTIRLRKKVQDSILLPVVFPVVFGAGAMTGLAEDMVESLKGILDLVKNFSAIVSGVWDFLKQIISDPEMAYELGKQVGINLADDVKKMINSDIYDFAYELGRLVGPFIITSILFFLGVWGLAFAKLGAWFAKFLAKFPKLQKAVRRIAKLIPEKMSYRHYGTPARKNSKVTGMPDKHFTEFKKVAEEQQVIAIVRNTNPKSLELIEIHHCPPKAKNLEGIAESSPNTGIVMAKDANAVRSKGYVVVDSKSIPRGADGKPFDVSQHKFFKLEPGQVIDPVSGKPIVGDYDLMGILDPNAPNRNLALIGSNYKEMENIASPSVNKFMNALNNRLNTKRILHGAQDQYGGFRGGATVFYPDGSVTFLPSQSDVEAFYSSPSILRKTITGEGADWPTSPKFDPVNPAPGVTPIADPDGSWWRKAEERHGG